MLTDMSRNAVTGDLYLLEFGVFDLNIFNIAPSSGKAWRLKPDGTRQLLAENLNYSPGLAIDAQGNLYISELATGRVLRFAGAASGVDEAEQEVSEMQLSPNPATDRVQLQYTLRTRVQVNIQVLDATGKQVFTLDQGIQDPGRHSFDWQPLHLSPGVYWVDIRTENGTQTQQLILH